MKKVLIGGLCFVMGGAAGAGATYFILDKKYKKQIDEEVASVKNTFNEMAKDLAKKNEEEKKSIKLSETVESQDNKSDFADGVMQDINLVQENIEKVKQNLFDQYKSTNEENPHEKVRYDKIEKLSADVEAVEEDDLPSIEMHKPKPAKQPSGAIGRSDPYFINEDSYGSEEDYNLVSLYLHTRDITVCDENDEPISDPTSTLGDINIEKICKGEVLGETVYIRNDNRLCDYEIVVVEDSYY